MATTGTAARPGIARGMVAGAVAAGVWALAEPRIARRLRTGYTDVRFLGRLLPTGRAWPLVGTAWHLANGAAFGAAFRRLGLGGWRQGVVAAEVENTLLTPFFPLVGRLHPDYRALRWRSPRGRRIVAQEVVMHAAFGALLGTLGRPRPPGAGTAVVPPEGERVRFRFDPKSFAVLSLLGIHEGTAYVDVSEDRLRVRFGRWGLCTDRANIRRASVAGPYRRARVIGPHLSLADRGVTFGTNAERGVCIEFVRPVRGEGPLRMFRHPNLTVTVEDPAGLAAALAPS